MSDSPQIYYFKLINNETVFAEIIDTSDDTVYVDYPLLMTSKTDKKGDMISLTQWLLFSEDDTIEIPLGSVLMLGKINEKFFDMYARTIIQCEIDTLKQEVYSQMTHEDTNHDMTVIKNGLFEMKEMCAKLEEKYGVSGPDFEEFEGVLKKYESEIQYH